MSLEVLERAIDLMDQHATYNAGCLEWRRATNEGYAVATIVGKRRYLHRVACEIEHGPAPEGKRCALHLCDNKCCVRPDHLYWGSHSENMRDAWTRGPGHATVESRTHCRNGHELTEENTSVSSEGWRRCRTCANRPRQRVRRRGK